MFKALWKLLSSDERVREALARSGASYDLSPDAPRLHANNDDPPVTDRRAKSRLWLEDWSEQDEERLRADHFWSGYGEQSAKDH